MCVRWFNFQCGIKISVLLFLKFWYMWVLFSYLTTTSYNRNRDCMCNPVKTLQAYTGLSWFPSYSSYCKLSNNELCLLLHTPICANMCVYQCMSMCSLKKTLIIQTTFSLQEPNVAWGLQWLKKNSRLSQRINNGSRYFPFGMLTAWAHTTPHYLSKKRFKFYPAFKKEKW